MASSRCALFFIFFLLSLVNAAREGDRITSLPGQPHVNFQQFGGYIFVDDYQQRALFYYFVEAETDPSSKPLVLWLSGGPGASSVGWGAFVEHGPFKPNGNKLIKNNYSWNKEANMLYLESPAGTGFSYSTNKSFYSYVDDDITARDNMIFLEHFLNEFPEFRSNAFYLTGESYAGHYLPQLAERIIKSELKINLKGIALGNPLLDFNTDWNARAEYLWSHGLISDASYDLFNNVCNFSTIRRQGEQGALSPSCRRVIDHANRELGHYVDFYDVTFEICLPSILNQSKKSPKIDVCVVDKTFFYLNREDVRRALHARLVDVKQWSLFSGGFYYNMKNMELPMIGILGSLIKSGVRVFAYSGDQDSIFPLTGTRILINKLAKELELNTTDGYRAWFQGEQIGGWTQVYGDNVLSLATIRGASHDVAFSQPERALVLFRYFILGQPLPTIDTWIGEDEMLGIFN